MKKLTRCVGLICLQFILSFNLKAETTTGVYITGNGNVSNYSLDWIDGSYFITPPFLDYLGDTYASNTQLNSLTVLNDKFAYATSPDNDKIVFFRINQALTADPFFGGLLLKPRLIKEDSYAFPECKYPAYITSSHGVLYVVCRGSDKILSLHVNPITGQIDEILNAVTTLGTQDGMEIIFSRRGAFAYTVHYNNNSISAFSHEGLGTLHDIGTFPTHGVSPVALEAGPLSSNDRQIFYVTNSASKDIAIEEVNRDGSLKHLNTISTGPYRPVRMKLIKASYSGVYYLWVSAIYDVKDKNGKVANKQGRLLRYYIDNNWNLVLKSEYKMTNIIGTIAYSKYGDYNYLYMTFPEAMSFAECELDKYGEIVGKCNYIPTTVYNPLDIKTYNFSWWKPE